MRFNSDKRMFNFAGCCLELLRSVLLVGAVTIYIILFLFRGNLLIMSKAKCDSFEGRLFPIFFTDIYIYTKLYLRLYR